MRTAACTEKSARRRGSFFMLCTALLFSTGGLFIKFIPWSPLSINGARSLIAAAVVGLYLWRTGHRPVFNRSVCIGALCMTGTTTLYTFANKLTTAANAIVLQFTAPVFIILFLFVVRGQKPNRLDSGVCAAVFFGIALFFIDGLSAGGMLGNGLALLSGVCYAGVFMLNTLPGGDSISSVLFGQLLSGLVGAPFLFFETDFSPTPVVFILLLGLVQMGLAYILLTVGLNSVPPVTASLLTGIEPVLNPIWVAIFCHETVSPLALCGAAVVILSVTGYNILTVRRGG